MPWEANARAANPGGDPDHNCLGEEQLGEPTVLDVVTPNTKGEPGAQPQMLSAMITVKLAALELHASTGIQPERCHS